MTKPHAFDFNIWILEFSPSVIALVIGCLRYVRMFSRRAFNILATLIRGSSRLRLTHPNHSRKNFRADPSYR